ncbi:beta strand repeat-containing protein [Iningainema tapete]|uniref:S-layer family protein n=1 Tax=Iningainema tapete BLCC-T55 TaxID=2748662 RepID=A0A8J6XH70_9CYAN|nr:S-layer family protein [Iningainema tapete]MBD2774263.1 S-layer family protein [Iningainema tapete BLCC-T55]
MFSQSFLHQWWQLGLASLLALVGASAGANDWAKAEIIPDQTLGNESSVLRPFAPNSPIDQIDGGARRGVNLFHSFEQFNIDVGKQVLFRNPSGIKNIISRVTGGSRSEILGTLGVTGGANLFLINPNGIIFGKDAKLALGGSFVGTTANTIRFGDQGFFSASAPDSPPLLVVNPSALLFNQIANQPITYQSTVGISANQSLLLVGGNVNVEGGQMFAPSSRIELGGLAGAGTVGLNVEGKNQGLSFPQNVQLADIFITKGAKVDVSHDQYDPGYIQISGRRVTIADRSDILANNNKGVRLGGTLAVRASELVEVIGGSRLLAGTKDAGTGGNLTIETGKLIIRDGAQVAAGTSSSGSGGTVTVRASDSVELSGTQADSENVSSILAQTDSAGDAGSVSIDTGRLIVTGGARVSTSSTSTSSGQAGKLVVRASDSVQLIGTSADDLEASGLFAQGEGSGKAGELTIETRQLIIRDGARASALTLGSAQLGGTLSVKASESVQLIGTSLNGLNSGLFVGTTSGSTGSAGELTIETQKLQVLDGALVSAGTAGERRGGSVIVRASNSVDLIGTSTNGQPSLLSTRSTGVGDAGNLMITTGQLTVKDGAQISSSSTGLGSAGDAQIQTDSLRLDQGQIISQTTSGNGGNITISVKDLLLLRRSSQISTTAGTAQQGGDGGNININAPSGFIVAAPNENSDITANASRGSGGRIIINASGIYGIAPLSRLELERLRPGDLDPGQLPTNDITAISQTNPSLSGTIELITPDVDPNRGVVQLPTNLVDASRQIATGCTPRAGQTSSFVTTGRGGLPLSPQEPLRPRAVITKWVTLDEQTGNYKDGEAKPQHSASEKQPIVEANGWIVHKGDIYLVASAPNAMSSGQNIPSASCTTSPNGLIKVSH